MNESVLSSLEDILMKSELGFVTAITTCHLVVRSLAGFTATAPLKFTCEFLFLIVYLITKAGTYFENKE